jgi:DNA-binding response OmpR family regulator
VLDVVSRVAGRSGVELLASEVTAEVPAVIREDPERVNMVMVDLLPRAQQMALLEEIRKQQQSVPLIALTQFDDRMSGTVACAKGADEILQKPITEHDVEVILRRIE